MIVRDAGGAHLRRVASIVAAAASVAAIARRVLGAPDYASYLAHARAHHPDTVPLTADEFARDALARRYDRPGSRCC